MRLKQMAVYARNAALTAAMLLTLALPAGAEGPITADMTMEEIRQIPELAGSGIYLYSKSEDHRPFYRDKRYTLALSEYLGNREGPVEAEALNKVIENYSAGIQVTHKLYSAEEVAQVPARENVELYYFPGDGTSRKYALVVGGNVGYSSGEMTEAYPTAIRLNQQGYTVFVLRYRIFFDASDNAPLEDVTRAVRYITAHAEEFGVQTEDYALVGFSSGGQLAGLFASEKHGYLQYGLPKPGCLMLAYPINDFVYGKPVYHVLMDPTECGWRYYWGLISDKITESFPPTYLWYGKNDVALKVLILNRQAPRIVRALERQGVPYQLTVFDDAPHACASGHDVDAEGWIADAVTFWEEQTAGHEN